MARSVRPYGELTMRAAMIHTTATATAVRPTKKYEYVSLRGSICVSSGCGMSARPAAPFRNVRAFVITVLAMIDVTSKAIAW